MRDILLIEYGRGTIHSPYLIMRLNELSRLLPTGITSTEGVSKEMGASSQ